MSSINGHLLDQYLKEGRKLNTKFVQDKVKGIILLKSAAVIGEIFTLKQLEFISPLINEDIETIMEILIDLQSRDFIEIIDDNDAKNWICRFTKKFLRETLYQRLLFRGQKKPLHQLSADYIQNNTNLEIDYEIEQNRLLNHILVAEDKSTEDKLSFKAKQAITVKKLYHIMIDRKRKIVKDGFLTKQGQKTSKKTEPRYLRLTRTELQWFHNQEEAKHEKTPLGTIPFKAIYSVIPAKTDKLTSDIFIDCTAWKKKNLDKGPRKFVFGAKTESERDDWITSIEYMKTKAIVESFTQTYANITFPIKSPAPKNKKIGGNTTNFEGQTSLGSMLKRQGDVMRQSITTFKKVPTVRRASKFQTIWEKKRLSNFSIEPMQPSNQEELIKDTASAIKGLFNVNMTYFLSQISENAIKGNAFQANILGKKPDCLRDVEFQDLEKAIKPASTVSKGLHSFDSESSAGISPNFKRGKKSLFGNDIKKDLANIELPQMQKNQSERVKIQTKLESLKDADSYTKESRPQKAAGAGIKEVIHEEEEELNITTDIERNKKNLAESSSKGDISHRKGKVATFNPNESEGEIMNTSEENYEQKPTSVQKESKQGHNAGEENHIDDDPTNKEDSDEEVHQKFKENIKKSEINKAPKNTQNTSHRQYEMNFNESRREHAHNASRSSNSKYSVPESENFGEKEFVVTTRNNNIENTKMKAKVRSAKNKAISIAKIQRSITNRKNNPTRYSDAFDHHFNGSVMNASQQQARNMMNTVDPGKNQKLASISSRFSNFYPTKDMIGVSRNSNSNSPFRTVEEDIGDAPNFGFGQTVPSQANPMSPEVMQNQMTNPLLTQMMMLMQQNTKIMAEQAKFIRGYAEGSKSRSRSRPKRSYNDHQESRSQLGMTSYSELDVEEDGYQPENLHHNSYSNERNMNTENIQQVSYDSRTRKIREIAKDTLLKAPISPEKQVETKTLGIVLRNTKCQINPRLGLFEGQIVTVEKYIGDLELYQCRSNNHTGLFKRDDIKVSKKKGERASSRTEETKHISQHKISSERRMDSSERDSRNSKRYYKENEYEDRVERVAKGPSYNTKESKNVESIDGILPYNSLRQPTDPSQREAKRALRVEEYKLEKRAFNNLQKEMVMDGDTFNDGGKLDYTITSHSASRQLNPNPNSGYSDTFPSQNKESRESNFQSATFNIREQKVPKTTLRKKNKLKGQNSQEASSGYNKDLQLTHVIHSQKIPERVGALYSSPLNESMSSSNSTTKSLKMQERKNRRKNAAQANHYDPQMRGPESYSEIKQGRRFN